MGPQTVLKLQETSTLLVWKCGKPELNSNIIKWLLLLTRIVITESFLFGTKVLPGIFGIFCVYHTWMKNKLKAHFRIYFHIFPISSCKTTFYWWTKYYYYSIIRYLITVNAIYVHSMCCVWWSDADCGDGDVERHHKTAGINNQNDAQCSLQHLWRSWECVLHQCAIGQSAYSIFI